MFPDSAGSGPHERPTRNRREFIRDGCCGFGGLALAAMLQQELARAGSANPLAPKPQHHPARARSVIFLYMAGGPSHLETFDPKPLLNRLHGQPRPKEFGEAKYQFVSKNAKLLGTRRTFRKYGESGIDVSDLFPHMARCVDDLAVIRSCHGDMVVHSAAQYELFTGRVTPGSPSMGSWVCYGLGSESDSLPAYVVMPDPRGALEAGQPMYTHGFLPAVYQPTMFRPGDRPVLNLDLPSDVGLSQRRRTLRLIRELNEATLDPHDEEFHARMTAYDLAFRMQTDAPKSWTSRASRARPSTSTASASSRPMTTAGAACWRAGSSRTACGSSAWSLGAGPATCNGMRTTTSRATTVARHPRPTSRSPACSGT